MKNEESEKSEASSDTIVELADIIGEKIAENKEEYNKYLLVLADDGPSQRSPKPFQPFGIGWNLYISIKSNKQQ